MRGMEKDISGRQQSFSVRGIAKPTGVVVLRCKLVLSCFPNCSCLCHIHISRFVADRFQSPLTTAGLPSLLESIRCRVSTMYQYIDTNFVRDVALP